VAEGLLKLSPLSLVTGGRVWPPGVMAAVEPQPRCAGQAELASISRIGNGMPQVGPLRCLNLGQQRRIEGFEEPRSVKRQSRGREAAFERGRASRRDH